MRRMRRTVASAGIRCIIVGLALWPCAAYCGEPNRHVRLAQSVAPSDTDTAAPNGRKLTEYTVARAAFERAAAAYWSATAEKRRTRNSKRRDKQEIVLDDYVLTQPPIYSGPPKPREPQAPPDEPPPARKYVPVVADILQAAARHFAFVPEQPADDLTFKRAYAQLAAAAGLTRDQIVRIYAFETGGNGRYDVQAGLEGGGPRARAITTALGYNQLLHVNSIGLIAEHGETIVKALQAKAAGLSGPAKTALEKKIAVLRAMMAHARTVPNAWSEHERLADTPKGFAIHALVLDIDVGPLLQRQKLLDSVAFARRNGVERPLSAAELEMMNLTGDGNGLDMVLMPEPMREQVPTSNFFLRGGYERNPVAIRNNVVARLIAATNARMDAAVKSQGARDLAAVYPGEPRRSRQE
jgi:hypothetical protein